MDCSAHVRKIATGFTEALQGDDRNIDHYEWMVLLTVTDTGAMGSTE